MSKLIDLFPNPMTSNSQYGITLIPSSQIYANYPACSAFDKNDATCWEYEGSGSLQIIFDKMQYIYNLNIKATASGEGAEQPTSIYYTTDGNNWIQFASRTCDTLTTIDLEKNVKGIKTECYGKYGYYLYTINFYTLNQSFLIQDGNNLCDTTGNDLNIKGTLPYTKDAFNNYGIHDLSLINKDVVSFISNNKYNIGMLR